MGAIITKFIVGLLLLPCMALSQEIVVVRGDGNYPPYEMQVANKLSGFHIELIEVVANTMGIKIRFESYPWKRALSMVKKGEVHAISFVGKDDDRSKYIFFTPGNEISFAHSGLVVLVSRKSEINFDGKQLTSLRHFKFGHNLGFIYGNYYDKAKLDKTPFNSNQQLFNMLRIQRIDIAMMNADEFSHRLSIKDKITKDLTMLDKKVAIANYIGFSRVKGLQGLAQKFSVAMVDFKRTPHFLKLMKKYKLEASQVLNYPL